MSQEDLARAMNTYGFTWRQSTVYKTETAQRPIRVNEAAALGEALGLHVAHLIGDARDGWAAHAHYLAVQGSLLRARARVEDARWHLQEQEKRVREWEARVEEAGQMLADASERVNGRGGESDGES
jgi:hypothetical protein